ncbi:diguanylate cyclase (GGDEF)-like protein/PAS domain S-box-containing protein [Oikeobacillus pervagus]|uniref:Diguanylate cyclase (GGDEF)-like protein/PAS domain S-box-containing protein n=1 Tax=Oikeobacillus pervagus TaxID=1325931 RepID=A0AAJ1T045_9BACI|nr:EAL domain-containing protein [Oikeobacillus pervagus]MDQ0215864.1 diguanylate cyclase (GGDEF)-like protein/PAS domain S-box-containing protein [Oikeobacillus pervagus]
MFNKKESKAIILLVFGILLLFGVRLFHDSIYTIFEPKNFLSYHTLLELFSIAVAFSIAIQGWMIFPHTLSRHRLIIAGIFLIISIFDSFHILSYNGMPFFITESSVAKATWFWIISRLTLALGLLLIFSKKDGEVNQKTRPIIFAVSALYVSITSFCIMFYSEKLPVLVIDGKGSTALKITFEYLISFLFLCSMVQLYRFYQKNKNPSYLTLIIALGFSFITELIFTLYKSVYDFDNLLGHIYKVISYYFIMKGIYVSTIEEPYLKQKETKDALKESEERLNTIVNMVPTGITITDASGRFIYANRAAKSLLNIKKGELLSEIIKKKSCKAKLSNTITQVHSYTRENHDVFITVTGNDNKQHTLSVNSAPILDKDQQVFNTIYSFTDLTDLIQAQKKINYLAYHDELTGLPNRYFLKERLIKLMKDIEDTPDISIMLFNLNRFKNVNDSLGNEIGDMFLQTVAKRLQVFCEQHHLLAIRMGGDEFAILQTDATDIPYVVRIVKKITKRLQDPMIAKGYKFHIDASVGIAMYKKEIANEEQLLKQANIAMHEAKRNGQSYMVFHPDMKKELYENIILENDLRHAIERNELVLYYQPQVNSHTGKIFGVEALIRWGHSEKGMISPEKFIPIAEESGLIVPIGKWVLEQACQQMKEWHNEGLPLIRVSVNLSLRQFFQDDLIDTVANALKTSGLDPKFLELEITESMTMNVDRTIIMLKKLKNLGVRIAIDDFGTGYSSLSYLHQFPIDQLKIDQSFIRNLQIDSQNEAIVETIISMAHHLRLELIAEGVETKDQMEFLHQFQCNGIQGFLISKPLPAEELAQLIKSSDSIKKVCSI